MKRDIIRQVVVGVAVLATIALNVLANALPLNGQNTGEISDRFPVYFTPAGYVFAIWGVIYLGLLAFAIYQGLPSQRENPRLRGIGTIFVASCAANIAWLFFWHYEVFPLTVVAMAILLLCLIAIYLRLGVGRSVVPAAEQWLVRLPLRVYLGWISVATIANVTTLLYFLNWGGWGIAPETWTVIILVIGLGLASVVSLDRGDMAFALVVAWAYVGIAVRNQTTPLVAVFAWVMAALVAAIAIAGPLIRSRWLAPSRAARR
jgi:benzodiazapine receptor